MEYVFQDKQMSLKSKINLKRCAAIRWLVILCWVFIYAGTIYAEKLCNEKETTTSESMNIENINWRVLALGDSPVSSLTGEERAYIRFDSEKKQVAGFGGCNRFFGGYQLTGASLTIGPLGSTRRACPAPYSGFETGFLKAIEATDEWKIESGHLALMKEGKTLVQFEVEKEAPSLPDLGSMTFLSTVLPAGKVTLTNGEYRESAAPGSASQIIVRLAETRAFGEIGEKPVGTVILVTETGGSGIFYDLALLVKDGGKWANTDVAFLGDRVKIDSIKIKADTIALTMKIHKEGDPQCCPSLDVVKRFKVNNGRMVPLQDE